MTGERAASVLSGATASQRSVAADRTWRATQYVPRAVRVELPADPPPIEGVSTSTVGFVGQTLRGPTEPGLVTSWPEFARSYGGLTDPGSLSYLPFAVKGFFDNGGRRAYIARVTPPAGSAGRATPLAAAASLDDFLVAAATGDRSGTGLRGLATIDEISLLAVPDEVHPNVRADVRAGIRDAADCPRPGTR